MTCGYCGGTGVTAHLLPCTCSQPARRQRGSCPKCGKDCAVNADGQVYPHRGPDGEYHSLLKAVQVRP